MKPARIRPLAEQDLVDRTRHLQTSGGAGPARRFLDAALEALQTVESMPGINSPLVGEMVGIPSLRRVGIEGFACGWFYLEQRDHLDVVRLLADRQDLETLLGSSD